MNNERYSEMCYLTSEVQKFMKACLISEYKDGDFFGDYNESLNYMFSRRLKRELWLRPYVCAMVFKQYGDLYVGESNAINPRIIPALTVSEIFNISTYQSNIVFDDKIKNETISNVNQFISSFVSFNIAVKILEGLDVNLPKRIACIDILNESNKDVYIGQYIDLNVLVIKNTKSILSMPEDYYVQLYLERCRRIGGTTVDTCASWAYYISGNDNPVELLKLRELFTTWGQLMQMANDLSDFTVFINQKDYVRYTDIRAGKITLPFYYILSSVSLESALSFISSMHNYDDAVLDRFFQQHLYLDSEIIKKVFYVMRDLWKKCRLLMNELKLDKKTFQFMFENAFLTKFSRCFFSNHLIRQL